MENVEGYIKWLHELAPSIQGGVTFEEYLNGFLESRKSQRHDTANSWAKGGSHKGAQYVDKTKTKHGSVNFEGSSSWKDSTNALTRMLSSAALYIKSGKKASALFLLVELDKIVEKFTDVADAQCQVIIHCKDVLWWQYYGDEKDKEMSVKFNAKWTELVCHSYEGEATVYFLKGMLAVKMRIDEEKIKEFFWTATLLDPRCLLWYHLAYRCFRQLRGKGNFYGEPSSREKELARTAYILSSGQNLVVAADYALMLKEIMWSKKDDQVLWDQYFHTYLDCIMAYERAIVMAKGTSLYTKIKLNFAELMYFGRGPYVARMRGKQLFAELEKENSDNVCVLHKLGNAYREERKLDLARYNYQRALTLAPTFMPCIVDYLKLLTRMSDYSEILVVINKALSPEFPRSDRDTSRLLMERDLALMEMRKRRCSEADMDDNWRQRK